MVPRSQHITRKAAAGLLNTFSSTVSWLGLAFLLAGLGFGLAHLGYLAAGGILAGVGGLHLLPTMDRYAALVAELRPATLWLLRVMLVAGLVLHGAWALGLLPAEVRVAFEAGSPQGTAVMLGWCGGGTVAMTLALLRPRS